MKKNPNMPCLMIVSMMALASFANVGCQTKSNNTEADSTQTDSVQANDTVASQADTVQAKEAVAPQAEAPKEENVLTPKEQENGDTRVFKFAEYQGKKWTVKDNGEKVTISNGDKSFTISNTDLQNHYVLNVLDARIYKGKIWLITYDDVAGRRAETEGTMFVNFDIATGKTRYVKSCSEANFQGKTIKYKEMVLTKRGESRAEDEYAAKWRTYNLDDNK